MNLNTCKILLLAAGLALAGCSDNNGGKNGSEESENTQAVYLKIDTKKGSNLRSDEPTASDTAAELYTAVVYFVDGDTDPLVYDVLTAGPNGQDVTMAELEAGYLVEDVNSAVTQVYVVGNYNSVDQENNGPTFPTNIGIRLSTVKDVILDIQQVSYPAITGVVLPSDNLVTVMDGQATLQRYGSNSSGWNGDTPLESDDTYANVVISPIVSRIEIEQIVYTGDLTSFTLEGIYVNYFYQRVPLSLDMNGYAPTNSTETGNYETTGGSFAYDYYTTLYDVLDEPAAIASGTATFEPDNGVWAYQVFGGSNPVPHIILRLTDVVTNGGATAEDLYLTITGYSVGGSELMTFERNTIYKIASLPFSDDDLALTPEPDTVNISVHVEVKEWDTVNVTPIL